MKSLFVPCKIVDDPIIRAKKCQKCGKTVVMLIFKQGLARNYDAEAIAEIIHEPLTKIVFAIHPNVFYGRWRGKCFTSKHFNGSVVHEYICQKCKIRIPEFIASINNLKFPVIKTNEQGCLIADMPEFDESRGCFITVTEFFNENNNDGILRLNYQTMPDDFEKVYQMLIK